MNRSETQYTEVGRPFLEKGSLRGDEKKLQSRELQGTISSWRFLESKGGGRELLIRYSPQAHNNNTVDTQSVPGITGLTHFITTAL